jgi:hypothetical protein
MAGERPQQLLEQLEAMHPRIYLIHNDAPRPETAVFELKDALQADVLTLKINVVGFGPTHDGHLDVTVMGDVPTAQARLDAMFDSNVARVEYGEPARQLPSEVFDTRLGERPLTCWSMPGGA